MSHTLRLEVELAIAEAGLGDLAAARARMSDLFARHTPHTGPVVLGYLHGARARLCLLTGDIEGYERAVDAAAEAYAPLEIPSLHERIATMRRMLAKHTARAIALDDGSCDRSLPTMIRASALSTILVVTALGCESKQERTTVQPRQKEAAPSALERTAPTESGANAFHPFTCGPRDPGKTSDEQRQAEAKHRGKALEVAKAVDFLSVRWVMGQSTESIGEVGKPCVRAKDQGACRSKLQTEAKRPELAKTTCSETPGAVCAQMIYGLTTERDEVRVLRSAQDFQELLGSIRSPEAAWLIAQLKLGASPYLCDKADFSAQRATDGGYLLRERRYTKRCAPQELKEFIYRVAPDGGATVVSETVLDSDPVGCENPTGH